MLHLLIQLARTYCTMLFWQRIRNWCRNLSRLTRTLKRWGTQGTQKTKRLRCSMSKANTQRCSIPCGTAQQVAQTSNSSRSSIKCLTAPASLRRTKKLGGTATLPLCWLWSTSNLKQSNSSFKSIKWKLKRLISRAKQLYKSQGWL